jgi:hypothetical protein
MWDQITINAPNIDTADFHESGVYKNQHDLSRIVDHEYASAMADWIHDRLSEFYAEPSQEVDLDPEIT